ncbi:transglutaminaseTgpA domain-containing protein, partial [Phytoactinopolyspora endophytica]|uniref:transglutaminase family protein n=1 Tax=Phytoactinopolyspora endophytica TaxID=1642495 RepID=UPI0013EE0373
GRSGVADIPGVDALARNGRRVGAFALIAAVTVPAMVPALTDGFVEGRGGGGGGGDGRTIRTDNPILDLQRNLNRPDNVDVLRYSASDDAPHYIRTVTLDSFDGDVWQTSDRPVPESQRVNDGLPDPPGMDLDDPLQVDFEFEITDNYSSRWLPLAYPAQQIEIEGDWRYDDDTLDVVSTDDDVLGTEYTAASLVISTEADTLREAGDHDSDVSDATELPGDLPDLVTDLAEQVTSDAETDFGRAAALQEWFRGPEFTYDITAQPGTSAGAVADFLNDRTGYCEQFAATMAIMARHLDIPARVAVGFTPGTYEGENTWLVRAHDAHAWPELYFEGVGWVRFEPTPAGRTGSAPSWTVQPTESTPVDNAPSPDSTSTVAPDQDAGRQVDDDTFDGGAGPTSGTPTRWPWVVVAVAAGVAALAWIPSGLARLRRSRRWHRAGDTSTAVAAAAWTDFSETVRDAGLAWDEAATPRSAGRSVIAGAGLWGEGKELVEHLIAVTERARYARTSEPAPELRADTAMLCRIIMRSRPMRRRARAFLWPTSLRDAWDSFTRKASNGLDRLDSAGARTRAFFDRTARSTLRR